MKLLTEQCNDYRTLYENVDNTDKKALFIEGIFMQADIRNRNGRMYPKHVMQKEVNRYINESINKRNSFGELNHPPTPTINLDKVSHLITSLREDGSNFIGKAKILETPMGVIAKNIIEGGGQLSVSSRGTGSLRNHNGTMMVQEDFRLSTAADLVSNPSAPDAVVDAIMESPDWVYDHAKQEWVMEEVINEIKNTKKAQLDEAKALRLLEKWATAFDSPVLNEFKMTSSSGSNTPTKYVLYDWGDNQVYNEAGTFTTPQLADAKLNNLYKKDPDAYGDLGILKMKGKERWKIFKRGGKFYQSKL